VTILFTANTLINGKIYEAGGKYAFTAAAEATQVAANTAIYWPPPVDLDANPRWIAIANLTFADFTAAAASQQIPVFNLAPHGIIQGMKIRHTTPFAGGSLSAFTVSVGDLGTVDLFASAFDVFQATGSRVYQLSSNFYAEDNTSPTCLYVNAIATGGNVNAATAGAVNIWALLSKS
jgi:hypothetical protein